MDATEERASTRRPMRADARRNHDLLVRTAAQAFEEQGPDICLEEIARRAGVGVGTLYRHFPDRQSLLAAVYREQIDALNAKSRLLLEAKKPGEALEAWMQMILENTLKQRGLKAALLNGPDKDASIILECKRLLRESGDELIARAQQAGQVRGDVRAGDLLRLIHGIVQVTPETPEGYEQAQRLVAIMLAGVRAQ